MIREPIAAKNVIDLDGPDGNAFALMKLAMKLARRNKFSPVAEDALLNKMRSSDYKNLVKVFDEYFGVLVF